MARLKMHRRAARGVLVAAALTVVVDGVAYATIPGSDGTIYGCYSRANAKSPYPLSVVDNPADCASPAVLLPFNAKGPPGAQGPPGPTGATGPTGSTEPAEPTGSTAPEAGSTSTRTVIVRSGSQALINNLHQTLGARGETAYNFTLAAHNASKRGAVTVTVKVILDGKPEEGSVSQTIPPERLRDRGRTAQVQRHAGWATSGAASVSVSGGRRPCRRAPFSPRARRLSPRHSTAARREQPRAPPRRRQRRFRRTRPRHNDA